MMSLRRSESCDKLVLLQCSDTKQRNSVYEISPYDTSNGDNSRYSYEVQMLHFWKVLSNSPHPARIRACSQLWGGFVLLSPTPYLSSTTHVGHQQRCLAIASLVNRYKNLMGHMQFRTMSPFFKKEKEMLFSSAVITIFSQTQMWQLCKGAATFPAFSMWDPLQLAIFISH